MKQNKNDINIRDIRPFLLCFVGILNIPKKTRKNLNIFDISSNVFYFN